HENADRVQGNELRDAPVEGGEDSRGHERQRDDPEREGEALATEGELSRHESVVGEHRRQSREAAEAGVRGEQQDDRRRYLHQVIEERAVAHERSREHAVDRFELELIGRDADTRREIREPKEKRGENSPHPDERDDGVARLWWLEVGNAVGDRLASGKTDGAGRERAQDEERRQRLDALRLEGV